MQKLALRVSGVVFLLMACAHLARLILKVEVLVGGKAMPVGASLAALIVLAALSVWIFRVSSRP